MIHQPENAGAYVGLPLRPIAGRKSEVDRKWDAGHGAGPFAQGRRAVQPGALDYGRTQIAHHSIAVTTRANVRWTRSGVLNRFVRLECCFLMFDRQRTIVGGHFSVMLAGNRVGRSFGTFFKHACTFNEVLGADHLAPRFEVQLN